MALLDKCFHSFTGSDLFRIILTRIFLDFQGPGVPSPAPHHLQGPKVGERPRLAHPGAIHQGGYTELQ